MNIKSMIRVRIHSVELELEDLARSLEESRLEGALEATDRAIRKLEIFQKAILQAIVEKRGAERASAEGRLREAKKPPAPSIKRKPHG